MKNENEEKDWTKVLFEARRKNLQTITADQQAFAEQKDLANGRKTFKAYLWQVCGEEYDAQH